MKLRQAIDITAFLASTEKCFGDVFLHTPGGNILNVKSLLSRYAVVSVCKPGELQKAKIVCTNDEDYAVLSDYIQPDPEDEK